MSGYSSHFYSLPPPNFLNSMVLKAFEIGAKIPFLSSPIFPFPPLAFSIHDMPYEIHCRHITQTSPEIEFFSPGPPPPFSSAGWLRAFCFPSTSFPASFSCFTMFTPHCLVPQRRIASPLQIFPPSFSTLPSFPHSPSFFQRVLYPIPVIYRLAPFFFSRTPFPLPLPRFPPRFVSTRGQKRRCPNGTVFMPALPPFFFYLTYKRPSFFSSFCKPVF